LNVEVVSTLPADPVREQRLLQAARTGDEPAFASLLEPYRRELHAHCYRMLGSAFDADDALQDASLRAWRAIGRFEGRSSLRSWLYTIATNTCLTQIQRRPKRVLPVDYGPATDPHAGPGEPVVETVWIEPYPDSEIEDGLAGPEARYEQRESIELAFIAALQHLPATQRAVLILREVLGFSAKEVAESMETTVASVNSALQRARASIEERAPEQSQQETLRTLGDDELEEIVRVYVDAWERNDIETVVSMLTEDAAIAMPPLASWFGPRDVMAEFLAAFPMSGAWRWKGVVTSANGQVAAGFYVWDEATDTYLPFALNVLTFRGDKVSDVVAFAVRTIDAVERERYHRWVDEPVDAARAQSTFARFGLPDQLD
jgi:RNA polymerase sigma-70 factor (ECF subfamily)